MKKFSILCLAFIYSGSMLFAQTAEKTIKVIVENPWKTAKTDEPVVIDIHSLNTGFTVKSAVVKEGNNEIPSQLDDLNFDLRADELAFVTNLPAQSKKVFTLTLSSAKTNKTYPARVFAEMLFRTAKSNTLQATAILIPFYSTMALLLKVNWLPTVSILTKSRQLIYTESSIKAWK